MKKKEVNYEKHEDLIEFEKMYTKRINEFLNDDPETRIVFLNADFGWGKTTFIKNNLKVLENNIYSPWLNKSDDYLEDIYYQVHKKDKGKSSSWALFISLLLTIFTIVLGSFVSVLIELNKSNNTVCYLKNFKLVCETTDNLKSLFICISIIVVIILVISWIFIFIKPVPIIKFFKKDNGKYYENKLIKEIMKKIDNVLVIEDIDRTDDIEEILIVANKISEYIKSKKLNKYILITGDYIRTIRRIAEPNFYDNNSINLSTYRNKGVFVVEKIISLRIDFSSIYERIKNLLKENNLSVNLTNIEYDEIVTFIKNKYLSIRFFIRFLKKYNQEISEGNSLYHLLLKYFQEEKYFNISDEVVMNSIYNINRFPSCLNDIEMMYQKGTIKINSKDYNDIQLFADEDSNYYIINKALKEIFDEQNENVITIFKQFYVSNCFPILEGDRRSSSNYNNKISVGSTLKPNNLKQDLDNYLLGYNNNEIDINESMLLNKRCYFNSKNSSNNFENYKINQVDILHAQDVSNEEFIYAYVACFFRENKREFEKNYPKLTEKTNLIVTQ